MRTTCRNKRENYLECKYRLPFLQPTPRHSTSSTLPQASQFHNHLLLTSSQPPLIIQILRIQRPTLLQTQLLQIRQKPIHIALSLTSHGLPAFPVRVYRANRRTRDAASTVHVRENPRPLLYVEHVGTCSESWQDGSPRWFLGIPASAHGGCKSEFRGGWTGGWALL